MEGKTRLKISPVPMADIVILGGHTREGGFQPYISGLSESASGLALAAPVVKRNRGAGWETIKAFL